MCKKNLLSLIGESELRNGYVVHTFKVSFAYNAKLFKMYQCTS